MHPALKLAPAPAEIGVSDAARALGRCGGRPKGSTTAAGDWLRFQIYQYQWAGYRCREAFELLQNAEKKDGRDALTVTDHTADCHDLPPEHRVTWDGFKKAWQRFNSGK